MRQQYHQQPVQPSIWQQSRLPVRCLWRQTLTIIYWYTHGDCGIDVPATERSTVDDSYKQ